MCLFKRRKKAATVPTQTVEDKISFFSSESCGFGHPDILSDAIADLKTSMISEFCAARERDMQSKIDMQGDLITQLRNQISNDNQTLAFNRAFAALDDKIDAIASKQPNTVPVQWPQLTAVNTTPYVSGGIYGNFNSPFNF